MGLHFLIFRGTTVGAMSPIADGLVPALGTQVQMPRRLSLIGAGCAVATITGASGAEIDIPGANRGLVCQQ